MSTRDKRTWLKDYRLQSLVSVRSLDRLYAGVHRESGQRVMIRQLLPGLPASEQESTAAVVAEHAERLATLADPHLLPVLEFTAQDGPLYLVTDVPRGTTVGELVAFAGTLPAEMVAALGIAIAKRLQYAHAKGVSHLALHRGSILLRPDGTVTVTELGLAAMWVERLGEKLRRVHSAWDAVYPEPGCVPPEVLANEPAGPYTDVYGLGALLFTLATTRTPFEGKSVVAFNSIVSAPLPPDPRSVYPDVDEALVDVIVGCLHRDPADRVYPDMGALIDALTPLAGPWPEVMADYTAALKDHSWLERFEPRLRVVEGGDEPAEPPAPPPAPAVVPLFEEPERPLSEAELLARMTAEQRAIYLSGGRERDTPSKQEQVRRGMLVGVCAAIIGAAFILPGALDRKGGSCDGEVQSAPKSAPPAEISEPSSEPPTVPLAVQVRDAESEDRARRRFNIVLYLD